MKKLLYLLLLLPLFGYGQLTPCEQDVENAIGLIGEYVPQCEEDGSYSSMQCWSSTGYCWCVDENGIEIPGTSIQSWLGTPDCSNNQEECVAIEIAGCAYIALWAPVCGCDGITYSNSGEAACNSIFEFTLGECGASNDILGCTNFIACNYDSLTTIDDGSCWFAEPFYNCDGICINDIDGNGICDENESILEVPGCTDEIACNFNDEANLDDGSCNYIDDVCESCEWGEIVDNDIDNDGICNDVDYDDGIGIAEIEKQNKLIKMIDVLGRDQKEHKKGFLLFYIYENGKVLKRIKY